MTPTLQTDDLILNEISAQDAEGIFHYASHEQIAKTTLWEAHRSIDDTLNYIQSTQKRICREPGKLFLAWSVKDASTQQIIGSVTLAQLASWRVQIGFTFHYDHWMNQKPIHALQTIIQWAFSECLPFERIQARCFPQTVASVALLERVGMKFEGVNRAMVKIEDQMVDLSCFAITRNDWNQLNARPDGWKISFEGLQGRI